MPSTKSGLRIIKSDGTRRSRTPKSARKTGPVSAAHRMSPLLDTPQIKLTPEEQAEAARFRARTVKRAAHRATVNRLVWQIRRSNKKRLYAVLDYAPREI